MRGTPSFRGSTSMCSITFEGVHSIISSFGIADSNHKELFTIHPTGVTCFVDFNKLSTDACNYLKKFNKYNTPHRRYHSHRLEHE